MATIMLSTFEPVLGKVTDAQSILKEGLEIMTGLGAKGRVGALLRGGVPNTLNITLEYADIETYGAAMDRAYADESVQLFLERAQDSQVMNPIHSADYAEIAGLEVPFEDLPETGVVMATLFKVRNGKQAASLERIKRSKALTEKHGAKVRFLQAITGDPSGLTVQAQYYPSLAAWGKAAKTLQADPEWQKFVAEIQGEDASADFLRTSLIRILN